MSMLGKRRMKLEMMLLDVMDSQQMHRTLTLISLRSILSLRANILHSLIDTFSI
jgi:hypothetical protein